MKATEDVNAKETAAEKIICENLGAIFNTKTIITLLMLTNVP